MEHVGLPHNHCVIKTKTILVLKKELVRLKPAFWVGADKLYKTKNLTFNNDIWHLTLIIIMICCISKKKRNRFKPRKQNYYLTTYLPPIYQRCQFQRWTQQSINEPLNEPWVHRVIRFLTWIITIGD